MFSAFHVESATWAQSPPNGKNLGASCSMLGPSRAQVDLGWAHMLTRNGELLDSLVHFLAACPGQKWPPLPSWSCAPVSTFSSGGFQCYKLHIGWAVCLRKGLPRTLQTATLLEWCPIPDTPPEWLPTTTTNSDRDAFFLDRAWRSGKQIWRIMG
jgi:hypothetical protein